MYPGKERRPNFIIKSLLVMSMEVEDGVDYTLLKGQLTEDCFPVCFMAIFSGPIPGSDVLWADSLEGGVSPENYYSKVFELGIPDPAKKIMEIDLPDKNVAEKSFHRLRRNNLPVMLLVFGKDRLTDEEYAELYFPVGMAADEAFLKFCGATRQAVSGIN